jgi:YD repeat-containing protein
VPELAGRVFSASLKLFRDMQSTTFAQIQRHLSVKLNIKHSTPDVLEILKPVLNGQGTIESWGLYVPDNSIEIYDATTSRMARKVMSHGAGVAYAYSDTSTPANVAPRAGLLLQMTDHLGRSLKLAYNAAGLVSRLTLPDGQSVFYAYDEPSGHCAAVNGTGTNSACQRLTSVTYADGKTRRYHFNETTHLAAGLNTAFAYLTGITDERGARLSNYRYDAAGRTVSSGWGGFDYALTYGDTQTSAASRHAQRPTFDSQPSRAGQ